MSCPEKLRVSVVLKMFVLKCCRLRASPAVRLFLSSTAQWADVVHLVGDDCIALHFYS